MKALLQSLFADKLVHDDREPLLSFKSSWRDDDDDGSDWVLLAPNLALWLQLLLVRVAAAAARNNNSTCCFAVVVLRLHVFTMVP
jgi:hypothetical protein